MTTAEQQATEAREVERLRDELARRAQQLKDRDYLIAEVVRLRAALNDETGAHLSWKAVAHGAEERAAKAEEDARCVEERLTEVVDLNDYNAVVKRAEAAEAEITRLRAALAEAQEEAADWKSSCEHRERACRAAEEQARVNLSLVDGWKARAEALAKALEWGLDNLSDDCSEWKERARAALAWRDKP